MAAPRTPVIAALVNTMLDALPPTVTALDATGEEVFSALMSCAQHAVNCGKDMGANMDMFRAACGEIYASCGEVPNSQRN